MFTLHDTIELTKKIVIFGVIGAVLIFVLYLLFQFGVFVKNTFFPTPPPAPQVTFGKLPKIDFGVSEEGSFVYTIDTLSGTLPEFSDRANVYKIVQPLPEFYDLSNAKDKASRIGFTSQPVAAAENIYRFDSPSNPLQPVLIMNTLTDDFTLTSNYLTYPAVVNGINAPSEVDAITGAEGLFKTMNSYPDYINSASTSAKPFYIRDGILTSSTSNATNQLYRIDFYRKTIDMLPIYYEKSPNSLMYAIVGGGDQNASIVEAHFVSKDVNEEAFSDYPIKISEEAFSELKSGQGHIASYFGTGQSVKITDVQLGYFMSEGKQEYLMPIYVFMGDNGFLAYISAVKGDLIAN